MAWILSAYYFHAFSDDRDAAVSRFEQCCDDATNVPRDVR